MTDPMLTVAQVAERLNVTQGTIREACRHPERRIPHYKIESVVRFRQSDVEQWKAGQL